MDKSTRIAPRVLAPALLAEHGILAPSPHNTQPWRVSLSENSLEIRPDHSRRLVADVTGRDDHELPVPRIELFRTGELMAGRFKIPVFVDETESQEGGAP